MWKALLIFLFGCIFSSALHSQRKSDFYICYGFAFPSGGYLSLRYYPADRMGLEIYTSAFWNIFNCGGRLNIHTTANLPHTYISIGYANISAYNLDVGYKAEKNTTTLLKRFVRGIDIGFGREVEYDFKHFSFQLGPTYILTMEDTFLNQDYEEETIESPPLFSYYLVGIQLARLPEKNPKPIRFKSY
jgi:hypothetical protein